MKIDGLQIVVLDRGFVYVGEVTVENDSCMIKNAKNIRRWGTSRGLGQLALEGPQKDTILDHTGVVCAPMRAVIHFIECDTNAWEE